MTLKRGDLAPDFEATTTNGERIKLSNLRGKRVALYFYPMDDTPGCTQQACSIRDGFADLRDADVVVLGISAQSQAQHQKFTDKHQLNFPLIVDENQSIARAYGAVGGLLLPLQKILGISKRMTILIGADGLVIEVLHNIDTRNHSTQIIRAFNADQSSP